MSSLLYFNASHNRITGALNLASKLQLHQDIVSLLAYAISPYGL